MMQNSFFSPEQFFLALNKTTSTLRPHLVLHDTIDSTSSDLMRRIAQGAAIGTTVVAAQQTAGRGRSGNQWHSKDTQNLYVSFSLKITGHIAKRLPLIPLAAGVAALETLTTLEIDNVQLKWPNDLLRNRKKVGGILCQTPGIENDEAVAVVGLGLNFSNHHFPPELSNIATGIAEMRKVHHGREHFCANWISRLLFWTHQLEQNAQAQLIAQWKHYGEPFGRKVKVGQIIGETIDLNDDGRLLVQTQDGEICSIPGGIVENI